jgi:hypothetical protein
VTRPCRDDHTDAAVCWRCSDAVPWWREARLAAGVPEPPPPQHPPRRRRQRRQRGFVLARTEAPRKGRPAWCCVCHARVRAPNERVKVAVLRGAETLGNGRVQASLHPECWAAVLRALTAVNNRKGEP